MTSKLRIALAQLNLTVGDVPGNTAAILESIETARTDGADLVVFQELALCGYPPEDLLLHAGMRARIAQALDDLCEASTNISILVGFPEYVDGQTFNSAALITNGEKVAVYRKWCLPNYSVFDEQRYFASGASTLVVNIKGIRIGVLICEDIWDSTPAAAAVTDGAEAIVVLNGSPYAVNRQQEREELLRRRALELHVPLIYQNLVGGQDELVFDGGSCAVDAEGNTVMRAPAFNEGLYSVDVGARGVVTPVSAANAVTELAGDEESIYNAIVTGVRDYALKNGFRGVVLGLSGGIDSALCLSIAVDALGADSVLAVMMPYHYTSDMSIEDAAEQAALLGVEHQVMPIETMVASAVGTLAERYGDDMDGIVEENIQARCRGMLLMAVSNQNGRIVLTTGNKSEMAVGYATLYGDMAGGFAPIKDCTKTLVYKLARFRNSLSPAIPERVITRPPSAELRPDQKDSDSLPDYDTLDAILDALMIEDLSVDEIVARGFEHDVVGGVLDMVRRNEYKRRQSPPGVRISGRAFGRDWRYPMTSGYGRS